jgi:hypothetical protein
MGEIERIDKKVKVQLTMLQDHDLMRSKHFNGLLDAENAREKPRVTYLEAINHSFNESIRIGEASEKMMKLTTEWNVIKAKLDKSSGEDGTTADPVAFAAALSELKAIDTKHLFKMCSLVKSKRRWRKFDTPLRSDLLNQYEFMRRVLKNAPKFLKRMGMSEKQRAAADAASFRMKMRWGF